MKGGKVVSELDTGGLKPAALNDDNASMHLVALYNACYASCKQK